MTHEQHTQFAHSLGQAAPPENCGPALQALWWDRKGDWQHAHEICQNDHSLNGAWVHAYLHRKEGDDWNAAYWYRRANRPIFTGSLADEWQHLVNKILDFGL